MPALLYSWLSSASFAMLAGLAMPSQAQHACFALLSTVLLCPA